MVYITWYDIHYMIWYTLHDIIYITWCDVHYMMWCTLHDIIYITWYNIHYMIWCTLHDVMYITWYDVHYMIWCTLHGMMYITWYDVHYMIWYTLHGMVYSTGYRMKCEFKGYHKVCLDDRAVSCTLLIRHAYGHWPWPLSSNSRSLCIKHPWAKTVTPAKNCVRRRKIGEAGWGWSFGQTDRHTDKSKKSLPNNDQEDPY